MPTTSAERSACGQPRGIGCCVHDFDRTTVPQVSAEWGLVVNLLWPGCCGDEVMAEPDQ